MKRCSKCILPDNFPNIKFNDEGVCNYCEWHIPVKYKGESALQNLINRYRQKGKKYDCIVPVSGGRDSSFVLYETVKKYKMRVLAVNYNSGFISEQAKENLKNAIKTLEVDFVSIKSERDIQKRCLRDLILTWALKPSSEAFPQLCYGCEEGYLYGSYKIAWKMKIPLIILGRSKLEHILFKEVVETRFHRSDFLHLLIKLMKNPFYLAPKIIYHHLILQAEFTLPAHLYLYTTRNPPKVINWFDCEEYDEEKIIQTITNKLGWKKPEFSSSWRFDCQIHAIIDYMYRKKLGFTEKDELYSKMIREGTLSRGEALKRIEREKENEEIQLVIINEVFEKLGLSKEKNRILSLLNRH